VAAPIPALLQYAFLQGHAFSPVRRDSLENRFFSPVTMKLMPTAATMRHYLRCSRGSRHRARTKACVIARGGRTAEASMSEASYVAGRFNEMIRP
jgi:hypothetical protein